ncbi:hypothetical protein ScPMuIL_005118 [Solemya velum]
MDLGQRFGITKSTAPRIFLNMVDVLYKRLKDEIVWQEREELRETMPMSFRALNITKSLKVKCLHEPEVRGEGSAQYGVVAVIDQQSKTVKSTYLTKKAIGRMSAGKFYMIRKVVATDIIRVREESLIMNTSPFTFDENIETEFLTPPKVGVLEALGSPRKRKLSVSGVVKEVSNIIEKNGTKRRMIKLSDVANDETITVKVWGEKVSIAPTIASQVALTHVVALNITKSLKVKCLHEPEVRGEGSAQYGVVAVIDQQSETVKSTYLTKKAIGRMSAGKFYIRKVVVTDIIRVREESLVSNIIEKNGTKRRMIKLSDVANDETITVKVWGEKARLLPPLRRKWPLPTWREDIIIVVNDDVYSLTKEQMDMISPAGEFVPGKIISGKRNGFKITAM